MTPIERSFEIHKQNEEWLFAAQVGLKLSQIHMNLGYLETAKADVEQCMDRVKHPVLHAHYGNLWRHLGYPKNADDWFKCSIADRSQKLDSKNVRSNYPYFDFLLDYKEKGANQVFKLIKEDTESGVSGLEWALLELARLRSKAILPEYSGQLEEIAEGLDHVVEELRRLLS